MAAIGGDMVFQASERLWDRARAVYPGGVNSINYMLPPGPVFIDHADGAEMFDVDGNRFVDFWCSHSALLLGHNHAAVREAVVAQVEAGTNFGLATEIQVRHAEEIQRRYPSMEKLVFTDSASKATSYAVRIARAFTGRQRIAKFQGGYHGTFDTLFFGLPVAHGFVGFLDADATKHGARVGHGEEPGKMAIRPGLSQRAAEDIVLLEWNLLEATTAIIDEAGDELAAIILEPVMGDGVVEPLPDFLPALRRICDERGIVLIFDETITGGMSTGGAQHVYEVTPDLTTLGKSMGGGMPVGAVGGRADVMAVTDVSRGTPPVAIGSTFPGHPLACAAGLAQLEHLTPDAYDTMRTLARRLERGIADLGRKHEVPLKATTAGHLFFLHWHPGPVTTFEDHFHCALEPLAHISRTLFERGVYVGYQGRGCVTAAHEEGHVDELLQGVDAALSTRLAG